MDRTRCYNMDCMEGMKEFPDKYFELAIVDPPYGISAGRMTMGKGSGNDTGKNKRSDWDKNIPTAEYFHELRRVSTNQIIWGGNYFGLPATRCYLIWDKMDYNSDFASAELAWTSFNEVVKTFRFSRQANTNKAVVPEMYKEFRRIHPTQKPVALYKWLLKNYAKEGDKILDTHGGSMSSVIACLDMGFSITCYELDPDYYNAGKNRIINHLKQLNAFRPSYDIEFHDNSGVSKLRNNAGIGYQEQKNGQNKEPIHRIDGLFHGDLTSKE